MFFYKNEKDYNVLKGTLLKGYLKNDENKMIAVPVDLDEKIDNFLKWYSKNMIKYSCFHDNSKHYQESIEVRKVCNFIEKMAAWYEFRFQDDDVIRIINHNDADEEYNIFSSKNYYFDYINFFECLNTDEKSFLADFQYPNLFYFDQGKRAHLHLNSDGTVSDSEFVFIYTNHKAKDEELIGMHIKDVIELLKKETLNHIAVMNLII